MAGTARAVQANRQLKDLDMNLSQARRRRKRVEEEDYKRRKEGDNKVYTFTTRPVHLVTVSIHLLSPNRFAKCLVILCSERSGALLIK